MFMCEKCHDKDKACNWEFGMHFSKSYGACEICRKTGGCVDCKAYKYVGKHALKRPK